jgi:hypothetical protein
MISSPPRIRDDGVTLTLVQIVVEVPDRNGLLAMKRWSRRRFRLDVAEGERHNDSVEKAMIQWIGRAKRTSWSPQRIDFRNGRFIIRRGRISDSNS